MKNILIIAVLLSVLSFCSCGNFNQPICEQHGHYPQLNYNSITAGNPIKQEAVFEIMESGGRMISYTHISGDTLETSATYDFENLNLKLADYIDSLEQMGFVFELRYYLNRFTIDAEEPATVETFSKWYFVVFEDSTLAPKDFGEAILPISSKTEAYMLAVSENDEFNTFWLPDSTIIDCKIEKLEESYSVTLADIKSSCEPQELEKVVYSVGLNGNITGTSNNQTVSYDCKCE